MGLPPDALGLLAQQQDKNPMAQLAQMPATPEQQIQQGVQQPGRFKQMLMGALWGASRGAFAAAGIESPEETQYKQGLLHVQQQNATGLDAERQQNVAASKAGMQLVDTPIGQMPKSTWDKIGPAFIRAQGGLDVQGAKNDGATALETLKQGSPVMKAKAAELQATAELKKAQNDPNSPAFKLAAQKIQWANYMKQKTMELQQRKADFAMNGPTSNMRTQGQMAGALLEHMDDLKSQIADLGSQGKLGPLAGRWSEFMAGKVGAGDPEYAALRTNLGLFQTALMKAHVGARGSEKIMEHFKNLFDVGKFTPESMDAALDSAGSYLRTYQKAGSFNGGEGNSGAGPKPTHRFNPATGKIEAISNAR